MFFDLCVYTTITYTIFKCKLMLLTVSWQMESQLM